MEMNRQAERLEWFPLFWFSTFFLRLMFPTGCISFVTIETARWSLPQCLLTLPDKKIELKKELANGEATADDCWFHLLREKATAESCWSYL